MKVRTVARDVFPALSVEVTDSVGLVGLARVCQAKLFVVT